MQSADHSCLVLIETYWNVKGRSASGLDQTPGINGNILECKDEFGEWTGKISYRINRNILEYKVKHIVNIILLKVLY